MEFILVRHFETPWNRSGLLQGSRDIDIHPDHPVDEAHRARLHESKPFCRVVCSPLKRTQQTARLLGFEEFDVRPELAEMDFGPMEGAPKESLHELEGDWRADPLQTELAPGLNAMLERIDRFVESHAHLDRVLVFGHGLWSRAAYARYVLGDANRMNSLRLGNGETLTIRI